MRIGIDVTALPSPSLGVGNYMVQLARALPRVDSVNDYIIFVKPNQSALFDATRAQLVLVPLASRTLRIAWEQAILPSLVRKYQLDVLHSPHYTMPFIKRCSSVVTFHDMTFFLYPELHLFYKRLFFGAMIPLSVRRADALIAISASTRADTVRLFNAKPEKIFTVPYGIDPSFRPISDPQTLDAIRQKYHLPEEFILYVGNLEPRKNLPMLIRAFARIADDDRDAYLVLAGSRGWKDSSVFSTVKELGLNRRVLFPGFIPQSDLPAVYALARAFVYASLYEGFGLPVLEAMACGCPVITSNLSSMPEIIGDAGIQVNPADEEQLFNSIQLVLTDTSRRETLARAGAERAKLYSWEETALQTLAVYQYAQSR